MSTTYSFHCGRHSKTNDEIGNIIRYDTEKEKNNIQRSRVHITGIARAKRILFNIIFPPSSNKKRSDKEKIIKLWIE